MKKIFGLFAVVLSGFLLTQCMDVDGIPPSVAIIEPSDDAEVIAGVPFRFEAIAVDNHQIRRTEIRLFYGDGSGDRTLFRINIDNPDRTDRVDIDTLITIPADVRPSSELMGDVYRLGFRAWDSNNYTGDFVILNVLPPQ